MRKNLQAIALLRSLSTGIDAPVLTLMVLSHGATLPTVSLMIGAYSFTVILAEFPSGVFADLYGRKLSFLVSTLFTLSAYTTLLFAHSAAPLLLSMVLMGLGRAFASGSIDALAIDEAQNDAALVKVTARLSILQSAGLAVGALLGGWLSGFGTDYQANIYTILGLMVLLAALTLFTVHEPRRTSPAAKDESGRLANHLRESFTFLRQPGLVRMLLIFTAVSGFAMLSLETYWQPALQSIAPAPWVFGVISSAGFLIIIVASKLTEHRLTHLKGNGLNLLLLLKLVLGLCLAALVLTKTTGAFIGIYILYYFFLGSGSVAEDTLLNRAAPSKQRASILSLFSFVLQIGGLAGSLSGYWVSAHTDFRVQWLVAGGLLVLCAGGYSLAQVFRHGPAVPAAAITPAVSASIDPAPTDSPIL